MTLTNYFSFFLFVAALSLGSTNAQEPQTIEFEVDLLGKIRGTKFMTIDTLTEYFQAQGIPYGKLNEKKRFLPSEVNEGRLIPIGDDEYFDATTPGSVCVQPSMSIKSYGLNPFPTANSSIGTKVTATGAEKCLNLNIYMRELPNPAEPRPLKPVIVFIHGGGFLSGSGDLYQAHRLLEHDVIFVTINYRMGVLGFFSLGTDDAPGNAALYDMVTALKWIQKYIKVFGGDPDSVTISGQSAGAAAVTHLMASPLTDGLFHKAIAMSGSALNPWGTTTSEKATKASLRISELASCYVPKEGVDPVLEKIINCMNLKEPLVLVEALDAYQAEEHLAGRLGFDGTSPVIQTAELAVTQKFLHKPPLEIFKNGEQKDVPFMAGATKHDGSYPLGVLYNRYLSPNGLLNDETYLKNKLVPDILEALGILDETNAVYESISKTYLRETKDSGNFTEMMPGLIDINSVFFFKASIFRTLQLHSEKATKNSYFYSFDYKSIDKTLFGLLFGFNPPPIYGGVTHSDDLIYIFAIPFFHMLTAEERQISMQMTEYWVNFAKYGNPSPLIRRSQKANGNIQSIIWPSYTDSAPEYLAVDKEFMIEQNYLGSWEGASDELIPIIATTTIEPNTSETTTAESDGSSTLITTTESDESTTAGSSSTRLTYTSLSVLTAYMILSICF